MLDVHLLNQSRIDALPVPPGAGNHYIVLHRFKEGGVFGAGVTADGTAGVKSAARGDISWTGHFTGKNDSLSLIMRVRNRYAGEQGSGIGVARILNDRLCGADFDDTPQVHDGGAVTYIANQRQVMRDIEAGKAHLAG